MTSWDPTQYGRFGDERLRPALDLIARIPTTPVSIWDLGCGTGSITSLLADRWPAAVVHGLDSSPAMLEEARGISGIEWLLGDIESWAPDRPADLLFSNAALQWLGDHELLFPRLAAQVGPGGALAVQMPRNFGEASHTLLAATAASSRWREAVGHLARKAPVAGPADYHRLLADRFTTVDIWETVYFHVLHGEDPVAQWARGTAARPYLDALPGDEDEFMEDYASRLREAYPPGKGGAVLFPFRRLFIIGVDPVA